MTTPTLGELVSGSRHGLVLASLVLVGCAGPSSKVVEIQERAAPDAEARAGAALLESSLREEFLRYAQRACIPTALGVYIQGKKAGWLVMKGQVASRDDEEVLEVETEFCLRASYEGEETSSISMTRETYALDGGALLVVEEREEEDGTIMERSAKFVGGKFQVIVRGEGYERTREVDPPRVGLAEELRFQAWLKSPPREGEVFEMLGVDLDSDSLEETTEIRYLGSCRSLLNGNLLPGHRLAFAMMGMEAEVTVLSDFRMVAGGFPGLLEFRLEDPAKVKELDGEPPEWATHVPCDETLGDPERVTFLELELKGAGAAVPANRRQQVEDRDGALRVQIWRDPEGGAPAPLTDEETRRYTSSSTWLQSDHPRIVERARSLGAGSRSRREAAQALMNWVFGMIDFSYARNSSTAVDVLTNLSGDCTEHALLFTAFARALGIPSRVVGGIAYAGDEVGGFAWHAWCEFHDGERWITVDPTWRQMPVDATHLELDEDAFDEDRSWVRSLGRLELWVVDSERD